MDLRQCRQHITANVRAAFTMMSVDSLQGAENGKGGNRRTSCPLYGCKRVYTEMDALQSHVKDHEMPTQSLPGKVFLCSTSGCSGSFPSMQKLMEHMRNHHKPNIFFLCENCRAKLRSYRGLLTHLHTCSKVPRGKMRAPDATPPLVAKPSTSPMATDPTPPPVDKPSTSPMATDLSPPPVPKPSTSPMATDLSPPPVPKPSTSPMATDPTAPPVDKPSTSPMATDSTAPPVSKPSTSPMATDPTAPPVDKPSTSPMATDPSPPPVDKPSTSPMATDHDTAQQDPMSSPLQISSQTQSAEAPPPASVSQLNAAPATLLDPSHLSNQEPSSPQLGLQHFTDASSQSQMQTEASNLSSLSPDGQTATADPLEPQGQHQPQSPQPVHPAPGLSAPSPPAVWRKNQGNRRILWEHTRGHYRCVQCGFSATNRRDMTSHVKTHNVSKPAGDTGAPAANT